MADIVLEEKAPLIFQTWLEGPRSAKTVLDEFVENLRIELQAEGWPHPMISKVRDDVRRGWMVSASHRVLVIPTSWEDEPIRIPASIWQVKRGS